jgi:hypothetical protein
VATCSLSNFFGGRKKQKERQGKGPIRTDLNNDRRNKEENVNKDGRIEIQEINTKEKRKNRRKK